MTCYHTINFIFTSISSLMFRQITMSVRQSVIMVSSLLAYPALKYLFLLFFGSATQQSPSSPPYIYQGFGSGSAGSACFCPARIRIRAKR